MYKLGTMAETLSSTERRARYGPPAEVPTLKKAALGWRWQKVSIKDGVTYYKRRPVTPPQKGRQSAPR